MGATLCPVRLSSGERPGTTRPGCRGAVSWGSWHDDGMARDAHRGAGRGWLLDELATAGRENLDVDHVARYDAKEDGGVAAEVSFCRELGLDGGWTVVDVGAGTGQFAIAVGEVCGRVVAVDVSAVMLERLGEKVVEAGLNNVELVHAGFLTYEHEGPPADLVYSRYALHHLPDAWKAVALERLGRVLRVGGVMRLWDVVYSFDPSEAEARLEEWCASGGEDPQHGWSRGELEEHVREEHSTFSWLLEPMIERAGLQIEDRSYSEDQIFAKYVLRKA
jgi:ubiquinone/menaquinone biosynthesis C-methylase UbiE